MFLTHEIQDRYSCSGMAFLDRANIAVTPKSSSEAFWAVVKLFLSLFMSWQLYLHCGKKGG